MAQTIGEGFNRGRGVTYKRPTKKKPKAKGAVPNPSRPNYSGSANASEYRLRNTPAPRYGGSVPIAQVTPRAKPKPKPAPKPQPKPSYTPRTSRSSGGGNRVRTGKSVGSNASGRISATTKAPKKAAPAKPKILTENQWLAGDTVYKKQKGDLASALAAYKNQNLLEGTNYTTNYNTQVNQLKRDKAQDAVSLLYDFASRGMGGSSAQGVANTDFANDWNTRFTDMANKKSQYATSLANDLSNFTATNTSALDQAKQDALQRRLLKYNL